ncbi:hypothetical protein BT63DRAFT_450343 [Microthyrium microscopicum]|uniref:Extracellular membrane protein CFEM domain-containing protein n=1 Tax=Microthyrium microscopicum TaxID=703497 RepID=A0A6A6UV46_9PEZI|nr:hypothetical protein BT63DRAFT_450343 [Microthyrium microscopicum]
MKTAFVLTGVLSLASAQLFGKGKTTGSSGTGKSGSSGLGGLFGKGSSGGLSGLSGLTDSLTCVNKCVTDGFGIDPTAMASGKMPTNLPCMDKMPTTADLTSGKTPDPLPLATCLCAEPKVKSVITCQSACGSIGSMVGSQLTTVCKDPKAAIDQMNSLAAKYGGAAAAGGMMGAGSTAPAASAPAPAAAPAATPKTGKTGTSKGKFGKGSSRRVMIQDDLRLKIVISACLRKHLKSL